MRAAPDSASVRFMAVDGYVLTGSLFPPAGRARARILIASALGVRRTYYAAFAAALASRGFEVLSFDYRGVGDSAAGPVRWAAMHMADWGRFDLQAALQFLGGRAPQLPLVLVGHSAGAQLVGLAASSAQLSAVVSVAGTAPYWRLYPQRFRSGFWLLLHVLIPALALGRHRFPAPRVGLAHFPLPAGVVRQWARWARTPGYLFDHISPEDLRRYGALQLPLLSWSFADDAYAPDAAVDALLQRFLRADIERRHLRPATPIGHFGFFRPEARTLLWEPTFTWLEQRLARLLPGA